MNTKVLKWIKISRLPFITASIFSAIIPLVWAWAFNKTADFLSGFLALFGVAFLHLSANSLNEYFDSTVSDSINKYPTPFSGGSRAVVEGLASKKDILKAVIFFLVISLILGIILIIRNRIGVLLLGFIGFLCAWLYSSRPFQLMNKGLGEIVLFLAFGPLISFGMGYALEGKYLFDYFLIGLPMGFLIVNILWINQFPDYEADKSVGKNNLVVKLGLSKARWGYVIFWSLFYLSLFLLIFFRLLYWQVALVVFTLPVTLKAIRILWKNFKEPLGLIPAQAFTIQLQMILGILISVGLIIGKFVSF